ncbi:MAG TPA: GNAT family N-acetyltransferase [Phycisphaerae bacterium]|nr:GNAT family N-acetyltransferase [Phycisphaerae bacterium]
MEKTGWPVTAFALRRNEAVVGGLIGMERTAGRTVDLEMIPLAPYAGPSRRNFHGDQSDGLAFWAEELPNRYSRVQLDLFPGWNDIRPFIHRGWSVEPRFTYINPLNADAEREISPSVLRRARRAARAGVVFDDGIAPEEFVALWAMTLQRRVVSEYVNRSALSEILSALTASGDCEILGTRLPDGSLVAANAILYDQTSAYFWLSGFDSDEPHRGASNQLCHVETLRRAAGRATQFDWLGANTPGIAEYKKTFGGELVPYYRVRWKRPASNIKTWTGWIRDCPLFRRSP